MTSDLLPGSRFVYAQLATIKVCAVKRVNSLLGAGLIHLDEAEAP